MTYTHDGATHSQKRKTKRTLTIFNVHNEVYMYTVRIVSQQ